VAPRVDATERPTAGRLRSCILGRFKCNIRMLGFQRTASRLAKFILWERSQERKSPLRMNMRIYCILAFFAPFGNTRGM
jgi:hypothetical protein